MTHSGAVATPRRNRAGKKMARTHAALLGAMLSLLEEKAFEQKVREFSKGMRQKLGIAIAMIKDAPALLLDEPTAGLDPKAGAEFLKTLVDLRTKEKAILMSTHDIFRSKDVADRVGIMKEGRMVMERTGARKSWAME